MKKILLLTLLILSIFSAYSAEFEIEFPGTAAEPLIYDIDDDGVLEMVVGGEGSIHLFDDGKEVNQGKWPIMQSGVPLDKIRVIDTGSEKNIIAFRRAEEKHIIGCYDITGEQKWEKKFPIKKSEDFKNEYPRAANVWMEHEKLFMAVSGGKVVVMNFSGEVEWEKDEKSSISSSVYYEDITGNGEKELIYKTDEGTVNVLDSSYGNIKGFPYKINTSESMKYEYGIDDIDQDGRKEIVCTNFSSGGNQTVFIIDSEGKLKKKATVTGKCIYKPAFVDLDNDGSKEVILNDFNGKVYAVTLGKEKIKGFPVSLTGKTKGKPLILDMDGDGKPEILVVSFPEDNTSSATLNIIDFKGSVTTEDLEEPMGPSIICRDVYFADLDGDRKLERIVFGKTKLKVTPIETGEKIIIKQLNSRYYYKY